ncbi:MAG: hypothetical protein ACKO9I_06400 [Sphaerospermopsis kisseleviana]|uniref:Uncharacterized protein n=1 Tax=Sphaerospermopsis reniformis TaxID=531300 RepID=A0A479ZY80_9CYAN|nr:hypothetical protein [Sphaerospermopsis reniformis]GCL36556.1 hypothetical protein SR1949_16600 [Sphaerospermopsis reniformis]
MILAKVKSINFQNSSSDEIPLYLQVLFNKIKLEHYAELYEPESSGRTSLDDTINEVLTSMRDSNETLTHLRYLWMTLILTLVVEPTLKYYQPKNLLPKRIINLLASRIIAIIISSINNTKNHISELSTEELLKAISKNRNFYIEKEIANFQILDEALDVFDNAVRVLNYDQSVEAILNILEDCLEGYAIFPGSQGRRELFNWWLLDVVPASYNLLPPKSFYVVEGVRNKEEIRSRQSRLLAKISKRIRSYLPELILEFKQHNNYIFPTPGKINRAALKNSGKIQYQSKNPQLAYS